MQYAKRLNRLALLLLVATRLVAATLSPECDAANRKALVLLDGGRTAEAAGQLSQIVSQRDVSMHDSLCMGVTLSNLAHALEYSGKLDAAEQAGDRSAKLLAEAFGPNSPELCLPLLLLARISLEKRRLSKTSSLLSRVESLPVHEHADLALTEGLRADLLDEKRDFRGAADKYRQSIAEWEEAGEGDSLDIQPELCNLAILYVNEGRVPEGIALLERALRIAEDPSRDSNTRVRILLAAAVAYTRHKDLKKAEGYFQRAVVLLDRLPPAIRIQDGQAVYREYATFLRTSGRKREAKDLEERAHLLFGPDTSQQLVGIDSLLPKSNRH
jgi:tetratricopeptide (TPR) repeat protein